MELGVPVIALAQLSRSVEGREDKRPMLSDLRESGSIEQDADIVAFLYRDDYYNKQASEESQVSESEFIIAKHRNGPTKTIPLKFTRNTSTFDDRITSYNVCYTKLLRTYLTFFTSLFVIVIISI